ncbi:HNH endonuclease signature motif containing protein [Glycomyces tarimensis]
MAKATRTPGRTERTERAAAIHTDLDETAARINAAHAQVLSRVIEANTWNIHRDVDGFSALRDWLVSTFDFHVRIAADIAVIAKLARKFRLLAGAGRAGTARIDQVAYAVRQFDKTTAMRTHARKPFPQPVPSPWNPEVECATPEALAVEFCTHAPLADLKRHLAEAEAGLAEHTELHDELSEATLQRLEIWEQDNGMWGLSALLPSTTGLMLDKLLKTAVPPPRQEEADADGVLPPAAGRNAEALHHMLGVYASDPNAPKRHGETCQLNLAVDVETLQGKDTGRTPTLEGRLVSLELARRLACESLVIPMVFNYSSGEAIELGRALRLPNTALRRKLVAEQPEGCAWAGCGRPAVQAEAHHIVPWWAGGETNADNLVLLCRFHHGRIHTPGWSVQKTGPGKAVIVHHDGHQGTDASCGCADWRTDADMDADFRDDVANVFPTGLYPDEWGPNLKDDLNTAAEAIEYERIEAEIRAARAKLRADFTTPAPRPEIATPTPPAESKRTRESVGVAPDYGPAPFLLRPLRGGRGGEGAS